MLERIRCLIVKELLALLRDPQSRIILIVPPLVQMLIFTFSATQEVKNVPVAVLNKDTGTHARDLIARLEGSPNFTRVVHLRSDADVAKALDAREVLMVVHIAADFSREVAAGRPAEVQLLLDGRRPPPWRSRPRCERPSAPPVRPAPLRRRRRSGGGRPW